jgi:2-keto-4-pentenoate hydratase
MNIATAGYIIHGNTPKPKRNDFKINLTAEERASHWLAEGNAAAELGKHEKAEKLYAKSQYWLDRANNSRGWGE